MMGTGAFAQLDSLNRIYKEATDDSSKGEALLQIGQYLLKNDRKDEGIVYFDRAIDHYKGMSKKDLAHAYEVTATVYGNVNEIARARSNFYKSISLYKALKAYGNMAEVHHRLGLVYHVANMYDSTIYHYNKEIEYAELAGNMKWLSSGYNDLGNYYIYTSLFPQALENYQRGLKIREEAKDTVGIIGSLSNIGLVYFNQSDHKNALKYHQKSLDMAITADIPLSMAIGYENTAADLLNLGKYTEAVKRYRQSVTISANNGYKNMLTHTLSGLGGSYFNAIEANVVFPNMSNDQVLDTGFFYLDSALILARQFNDRYIIVYIYNSLGDGYRLQEDLDAAIKYYNMAADLAWEIGAINEYSGSAKMLNKVYQQSGDFEKAYYWLNKYIVAKDSILNEEQLQAITRQEMQFEFDKKEAVNKEKSKSQRFIITIVSIGLGMLLFLSIFLFNRIRITSRQKQQIERQKMEVEEKNREITDSMQYAKRLQDAILPPPKLWKKTLPEGFVLYKPKDIVAGDFYWLETMGDIVYFAAADCTGHGVPGAMVSVVCANALNKAVREMQITDPGEILNKTRELVLMQFERSEEEVKDGMDIALCSLSLNENLLQYAGANNPLWIINPNRTEWPQNVQPFKGITEGAEIKADKQPVGKHAFADPFKTHRVNLQPGDEIVIFSDGFADQFGGLKGKKLKYKALKELLIKNYHLPLEEQRQELDKAFENWRGSLEQVDDVCVIGVRV